MSQQKDQLSKQDKYFLEMCVNLAEEALKAGDKPFGSVLVGENENILATSRNRINEKTVLAQWACDNLDLEERQKATLYTSGEHCPMCAGAHAWAEIGELVFLSSAKQLTGWLKQKGVTKSPINFVPSRDIINYGKVKGPFEGELFERIKALQLKA
ncbi:hypothetical protein CAP47_11325 [Psychroflexus sp. S27]|uniref:nucleoside deaminase n=1 Tax=Psychroflexus sp. S27 TaxID=1982757 RepID=UPI000C2B096B|nr:nucleoside deaminase [Psychroflexus sp. S27]PJX20117.1 hypothetical protein CAP47_11325 [Psychroflexus sp. S27]